MRRKSAGGAQFQLTRQVFERLAEALETSGIDIVPRVQITTGGGEGGGGSMQALLGMLLSEKGTGFLAGPTAKDIAPEEVDEVAAE